MRRGRALAATVLLFVSVSTAAHAAISGTSGQMTKLAVAPPSVLENALVSNTTIFTFDEQQGVTLGAPLAVDINAPGVYDELDDLLPRTPATTIPAGTVVDSHLVHADSVGTTPVTLSGTVTFGSEILGVVVRRTNLGASDFLGAPGTLYPGATATRVIEFDNGDIVILPDLRTVQVTLRVSVGFDQIRVITRHNAPPVADAGGPYAGTEGAPVTLSGTASDPDGDPVTVAWSFSVVAADPGTTCTPSGTSGLTPSLVCDDDAVVTATLTATDGANAPVSASTTVVVANAPPAAGPLTVAPVGPVALGSAVVVSVPFGDPGANDTHAVTVAWGDTTSSAATVTESGGSGAGTAGHVYAAPGIYTVTATVTDDDGGTATVTATVTVNGPPSADAGGPYAGSEGMTVGLAGTVADPENDPLTTTWTFTPTLADPGTVCTPADVDTLAPSLTCNDDAVVDVNLAVDDGVNPPTHSTTTLTVANAPPVLGLLAASPAAPAVGQPVTVTAAFTDPGTNDTHTGVVAWGDTTTSAASVTGGAGAGTAAASHTYTAPGVYTVTLTVTDDNGGTATATTTVVVNSPPTADAGGPYAGPEGAVLTLAASAADPDGDPLTVSWSFTVVSADPGTVCTPAGVTTLAPTLVCNDDAQVSAVLQVSDGVNPPVTSVASLQVGNAVPVVSALAPSASLVPVGATVSVTASFTDAGANDTHAATVDWGDGTTTAGVVVQSPGSGTVSAAHAYAAAGTYVVTLTVVDDDGGSADAQVTIVANGAPVAGAGGPYAGTEGAPVVLSGTAVDPDADALDVSWAFTVVGGDPGTTCSPSGAATLTPVLTCDDDAEVLALLTVTDGVNDPVVDTALVSVSNAAPTVTAAQATPAVVPLGGATVLTAAFSDPGANDTHTALVGWGDGSTTAATVAQGAGGGSLSAAHTYAAPGTYTATVTVTDDDGGEASATVVVTVNAPPTVSVPALFTGTEGAPVTLAATVADPDGGPLGIAWSFDVVAADPGTTCLTAATSSLTPTVACDDDAEIDATVSVSDGINPPVTATARVRIANVAPVVGALAIPVSPVPVGTAVTVSASFTDAGANDTHTATVDWGDATSSPAAVNEGAGTLSGAHTFAAAGTYTVSVTVTDDDGGTGTQVATTYVVVYDPSAGFVTGGGWVTTPPGSFTPGDPADPDVTGRANFGFVARYQPGATVPSGSTEFNLRVAGVNLKSSSYAWLVVTGATTKAYWLGTGTVNGVAGHGFLVSVIDGRTSGGPDRFRIRIWRLSDGWVLVDTQPGAPDDASATLAIGGGSVVIHDG